MAKLGEKHEKIFNTHLRIPIYFSFQYVFVNRRLVNKSYLLKQINAEFKILRSQKLYPAFVLFFDCPWKEVDFTFEPRKTEVVFEKPQEITTII